METILFSDTWFSLYFLYKDNAIVNVCNFDHFLA
jgi:hypothetical protein